MIQSRCQTRPEESYGIPRVACGPAFDLALIGTTGRTRIFHRSLLETRGDRLGLA